MVTCRQKLWEIFHAGEKAGHEGKPITENPHPPKPEQYHATWNIGWKCGNLEREGGNTPPEFDTEEDQTPDIIDHEDE